MPEDDLLSPTDASRLLVKLHQLKADLPRDKQQLKTVRKEVADIRDQVKKTLDTLRLRRDRLLTAAPEIGKYLELRNVERDRPLAPHERVELRNTGIEIAKTLVKVRALKEVRRIWKRIMQIGLVAESCDAVRSTLDLTALELGARQQNAKGTVRLRTAATRKPRAETIKRRHVIHMVAKTNARSRGRNLDGLTCAELDRNRIALPSSWDSAAGVSNWTEALRTAKLTGRVRKLLSVERKKAL